MMPIQGSRLADKWSRSLSQYVTVCVSLFVCRCSACLSACLPARLYKDSFVGRCRSRSSRYVRVAAPKRPRRRMPDADADQMIRPATPVSAACARLPYELHLLRQDI